MNTHLRKALLLLLIVAGGQTLSAQTYTKLLLWQKDGTKSAFVLANKPVAKFMGDSLRITAGAESIALPMKNVLRYTFESQNVGIDEVTGKLKVQQSGESIRIDGISAGVKVGLFTVDGKKCAGGKTTEGGSYQLQLGKLNTGVYILKVGDTSLKITRP